MPRVGDQHFADEVRVTRQVEVYRAEAVVGEVAVGTGDLPRNSGGSRRNARNEAPECGPGVPAAVRALPSCR